MSEITLPSLINDMPNQLSQGGPEYIVAAAREINSSIPDAPDVVGVMMSRGSTVSATNLLLSLSGHGLTIRQFYLNRIDEPASTQLIDQFNFTQTNGNPSDEDFAWLERRGGRIVAELVPERTFARITAAQAKEVGSFSLIMLTQRIVPSTGVVIRP